MSRLRSDDQPSRAEELLEESGSYLSRPVRVIRQFRVANLRYDALAGLTVAVVMLPQAMAYALIAELPPQTGIYSAIVASVVAILWGSSRYLHTGPTNTASLLVLSTLIAVAEPGSPQYIAAAGLLALMVGLIRLFMGLARMGVLVNFVADSVVVGFAAGAGILIAINQLPHVLRLDVPSRPLVFNLLYGVVQALPATHWPSVAIAAGTIATMLALKWLRPTWPSALLVMIVAAAVVWICGLDQHGVQVVGEIPRGLPPLAPLPLGDVHLIRELATGALAIAVIGLVEAISIARLIAVKTGERIDANQEFVGQGLANIAAGWCSGFTCSGSFTRTVVNHSTGARSAFAVVFSALFLLVIALVLAPLAAFIPRAALAGMLVVIGLRLVDRKRMAAVWRVSRGDTTIMLATLAATMIFPLEFAVLTGVLVSFARHLIETSQPKVESVGLRGRSTPDQADTVERSPWSILTIRGSLYFGATAHVEDEIRKHFDEHPHQRYLLLAMQQVNRCDITGLRMLWSVMDQLRARGGDLFLTGVNESVRRKMTLSGFDAALGPDHFLPEDQAFDRLAELAADSSRSAAPVQSHS